MYVLAWTLSASKLISTQTFRRALTVSVKRCAEIVSLQWRSHFWQSLEDGFGKRGMECASVSVCESATPPPCSEVRSCVKVEVAVLGVFVTVPHIS